MTYLDHNATTPLVPGLYAFLLPYFEAEFGNPSSLSYSLGQAAKETIENARVEVADLIGAKTNEVVFTSGGTESINLGILGLASAMNPGDIIMRTAVEHPAVKESIQFSIKAFKIEEVIIPVNTDGALDVSGAFNGIRDISRVKLVSSMLANNETGILHELHYLKSILPSDTLLHVDATQGIGKIPFSFKDLNIDLCSFSAHKFGGPKGIGALIIKEGINWNSPMNGGGQEGGRRGGTENVALIAGLGFAAKVVKEKLKLNYSERIAKLRDYFEERLRREIPESEIIGSNSKRLPNTSNVIIPGIVSANLVKKLGEKGICISTGSACKASSFSPSPVLSAMGFSAMSSASAIRVSFGEGNQETDADKLIDAIITFCKEQIKIEELLK